jgi:hypothetical protein
MGCPTIAANYLSLIPDEEACRIIYKSQVFIEDRQQLYRMPESCRGENTLAFRDSALLKAIVSVT